MARKKKNEPTETMALIGDNLVKIAIRTGKDPMELRRMNRSYVPGIGKKVNI